MAEYTSPNPPDQTPGNQAGAGANGPVAPDYLGRVEPQALTTEVEGSFVDYAMSVIVSRALPDARDGLKPVQRRILYAMHSDLRLRPGSPYKKSARIVGEVLGKYHPHGDGSVYESMARMVQDFSLRYPLVDGQGNFGSVDGDNPAAMRYTEARMARLAASMLSDIDEDTVAWKENFDDSLQEPVVLPAQVPNLLINGTTGIAVGMATNIPPHNLGEIVEAQKFIIDHWERRHSLSVEELMVYVKGPDFPLGGQILGTDGIREAFETGRGRIVVRAEGRIEEIPGRHRTRLVFESIPYGVNKASMIARIAEIVNKGERLQDIVDMRDESGRDGIRLVLDLKSSATPQRVLNQIYKFSDLQMSFAVTLRALLDNQPVVLNLRQALLCHLDHRIDVVERRTRFRREKVRARAHVLEGLLKALANIDRVVEIVRGSDAAVEASTRLQGEFKLTERQAQEILDMPLRRLAALERQRLEDEYREALEQIRGFTELLENPFKLRQVVREELDKLRENHQDPRKTRILYGVQPELSDEDLVVKQDDLVVVWQSQYTRRTLATEYRGQGLGGQGVTGRSDKEESAVEHLLYANSLDSYLFFTNRGRVYPCRAHALPEGSRTGRGETLRGIDCPGTGGRGPSRPAPADRCALAQRGPRNASGTHQAHADVRILQVADRRKICHHPAQRGFHRQSRCDQRAEQAVPVDSPGQGLAPGRKWNPPPRLHRQRSAGHPATGRRCGDRLPAGDGQRQCCASVRQRQGQAHGHGAVVGQGPEHPRQLGNLPPPPGRIGTDCLRCSGDRRQGTGDCDSTRQSDANSGRRPARPVAQCRRQPNHPCGSRRPSGVGGSRATNRGSGSRRYRDSALVGRS